MKYNKHIIFFCPGFPNDEKETDCIPAMQNFIKGFTENHQDLKISVINFFFNLKRKKYKWYTADVYSIKKNGVGSFRLIRVINLYFLLKKIVQKDEHTIIQSFWLNECAFVGHWFSKLFKISHFCMVMGQDASVRNKFRHILPIKKLTIFCPNELSNQKLLDVFGREANYIIPRGIDNENFKNASNSKRHIDILGVGNLCELKNYTSFLRIIKKLVEFIPDLKTVLIGKGEEEDLLKNFIIENNLDLNVSLLGYLRREEVIKTMEASKILLHTSSFEDESYTITEALFSGMYAVGFNKVNNERENLLLGDTEDELASICSSLLRNYKTPKKSSVYTIKQMANAFYEIYFFKNEKITNSYL